MSAAASTGPWVVVPPVASPFDAFSIAPDTEEYWSRIEEQDCCTSGPVSIPVGLIDLAKDIANDEDDGMTLATLCSRV
jgi:hypothetical protein